MRVRLNGLAAMDLGTRYRTRILLNKWVVGAGWTRTRQWNVKEMDDEIRKLLCMPAIRRWGYMAVLKLCLDLLTR